MSTATIADLPAVLELERLGFDSAQRWSAASWRAEIEGERRRVLVHGGTGAGLLAVAGFTVLGEDAELLRVVVHPDHRGTGLGRDLVERGKRWAIGQGARRMLLEVRHDNRPALGLYGSTGFAPIARRADYYGAGLDAVVMVCDLVEGELK